MKTASIFRRLLTSRNNNGCRQMSLVSCLKEHFYEEDHIRLQESVIKLGKWHVAKFYQELLFYNFKAKYWISLYRMYLFGVSLKEKFHNLLLFIFKLT